MVTWTKEIGAIELFFADLPEATHTVPKTKNKLHLDLRMPGLAIPGAWSRRRVPWPARARGGMYLRSCRALAVWAAVNQLS
jgi:hypothetical protein